ncbi:MAG: gluconokinase [Proteobacteria bacterium]|nr:gluconokinase [Pseudomonadota bacterium]MBI3498562.1 gluconokinase [Pseudomonadota bacterium]
MGVCGSGKSTVGQALARKIGADFAEGDRWHPPENIAKMTKGVPLEDADRWPWLDALARAIEGWVAARQRTVLTCSALRESYREVLTQGRAGVSLVYLKGDQQLIAERLARRRDHFMPAALLPSQFAQLEEPAGVPAIDIAPPPDAVAETIKKTLGL